MSRLQYIFKTDTLFKMLFVQNPDLLQQLVAELLGIPYESIEQFDIQNSEMPPEAMGDKFCRLDINMVVNGQLVDLEVQVSNEGDHPERVLYYWAREFSSALRFGQTCATLPGRTTISIVDLLLFDGEEYHSFFQPMEISRHSLLSDKIGFHFYELPKLPKEVGKDDMLLLWLSRFKAETEEELEKIKALEVPVISQAIKAYYTITASSEFKELERLRAKARHDEAQALYHAEQVGMEKGMSKRNLEIARNLIRMEMPLKQVSQATGLTMEELSHLDIR